LRAALEAIALQSGDVITRMAEESQHDIQELRADGGAANNAALMQIQAQVIGRPVRVSARTESTALGAAYMAGLQAGIWHDEGQFKDLWRASATYRPTLSEPERDALVAGWQQAIAQARHRIDPDA